MHGAGDPRLSVQKAQQLFFFGGGEGLARLGIIHGRPHKAHGGAIQDAVTHGEIEHGAQQLVPLFRRSAVADGHRRIDKLL